MKEMHSMLVGNCFSNVVSYKCIGARRIKIYSNYTYAYEH